MNKELSEIIKIYATGKTKQLNEYLIGMSKNNIIAVLIDLITMYINDKNSSTLREFVTVTISGFEHTEGKIGYNGYKHNIYGKPLMCEAKPKNVSLEGKRKLNGGGNFTDFTYGRLEKYLKENLFMLVSGFVDGKLIYIIEFPFNIEKFKEKLKKQLFKRFPNRKDIKGQYLRSVNFDYRDYINYNIKMHFLLSKKELKKYKNSIVKKFFNFLWDKAKDE